MEVHAMTIPPMRYGVVLDTEGVNEWQATVLEHLQESTEAELVLVVVRSAASRRTREASGSVRRRRSFGDRLGARAFHAYTTRLSRPRALRPAGASPWPEGTGILRVIPVRAGRAGITFPPDAVEAIKGHSLDFLLHLGSGTLRGSVLEAARLGAWSFHFGDPLLFRGQPPGFWELVDGQPAVGAALLRLNEGPEGAVMLRKGWFAVAPESYGLTRDRLLLGTAAWPAVVCRAIRLGAAGSEEVSPVATGVGGTPGMVPLMRFLSRTTAARVRKYWHHGLRHDDWNIGVIDAPASALLSSGSIPTVQWAPGRRGRYAADPLGRTSDGTLDVLYEDYARGLGYASIATRKWTKAAGWAAPEPALAIGSHLSYPFLQERDGRLLMLPESQASGHLILYEADRCEGPWRPVADTGLGGGIADATLLQHAGRWWLFGARSDRLNPATELLLWFADRPEGPWTEHPLNPVVVDVRSARPAGPCFIVDGQLYRPAQDCSTGYGDRLAVKRVVTLTTERFEEAIECFLEPERDGPYRWGLHTLTAMGDVTLVDGKRWVWSTAGTVRGIRRRLRR